MKFTQYFQVMRQRSDRMNIKIEWIEQVVENPIKEIIQQDGRIRRWGIIEEMESKYLRVILLPDKETIHNAFFDRSFKP
jgi:CHAD domain-containing protein